MEKTFQITSRIRWVGILSCVVMEMRAKTLFYFFLLSRAMNVMLLLEGKEFIGSNNENATLTSS